MTVCSGANCNELIDGLHGYCEWCDQFEGEKSDAGEVKEWIHCEQCVDGFTGHDCGEDCCCCLNPEPNVECEVCDGEGGWYE